MHRFIRFCIGLVLLFVPLTANAQVFSQNQVILPPFGSNGFVVSTTTANGAKLSATSTPYFANFFATNANITRLGNLTGNGLVKTSGGNGAVSIATNGSDYTLITAITCSAGQFLNAFTAAGIGNCVTAGSSASSTLLSDSNTFSGANIFTQTITGSVSGNAGTATKFATARTISITGDLAYTSPSFDGSGNVTAAGTLATVNTNVGSFTNANITVNGKGLVTAASNGTAPITYTGVYPIVVTGSVISTPLATTTIQQTYGTAQIGQITLSTSTDSFNGLSLNEIITNSGGTFNFANMVTGTLNNSGLTNPATTVNSQTCTLGSTCTVTAASSSLLGDSNTFSGNDTFSNTITGSVSGNAGTATVLQNRRSINGIHFDGSSDIVINAASSSLLGDSNTFSGNNLFTSSTTFSSQLNINQSSTSLATFANVYDTALTPGDCVQAGAGGILTTTGSACGSGSGGVTSIQQTYGTTQSGAITLATTSASFNGLTVADAITNSGTTFTIFPLWSGTLNNSGLTNPSTTVNSQTCTLGSSCTVTAASSTLLANNNTFSGQDIFSNASTSLLTITTGWIPSLGTSAGSFLAVDPNGKIIATTTPSGGSSSGAVSIPVQLATTGALPSYTFAANVITEVGTGALTVDGTAAVIGNRILVKNESGTCSTTGGSCNNGIYSVTAAGSGIAAYVITRVSDYNSSANVIPGEATYVIGGATLADDWWALQTVAPITVAGGGTGSNLTYLETAATGVTSVNGTTNQITSSGGTTPTLSLPSLVIFPGNIEAFASSTIGNGTVTGGLTVAGTATTSNLINTNITSAIAIFDANHKEGAYSGTSCTNQFVRSLNGSGVATCNTVSLTTDVNGTLQAAQFPALTGDLTTTAGSLATTLSTVNSNVGSFTSANITVNAKGLITAAANGTGGGGSAYPFGLTGNATSTLTQFNGGLTAFASSTIGNGTQISGLTINGGSTTTLAAYFGTNLGVGTSTPWGDISITNDTVDPGFVIANAANTAIQFMVNMFGEVLVGTSTPGVAQMTIASSTAPQFTLSDGISGDNNWAFRAISGNLYISTSTVSATSTQADPYSGGIEFPSTGGCFGCSDILMPGGINLKDGTYIDATSSNPSANVISTIYTAPVGRRAYIVTGNIINTSGSSVNSQLFVNINGFQFALNNTTTVATGGNANILASANSIILNPGDSLDVIQTVASQAITTRVMILEYSSDTPFFSAELTNVVGTTTLLATGSNSANIVGFNAFTFAGAGSLYCYNATASTDNLKKFILKTGQTAVDGMNNIGPSGLCNAGGQVSSASIPTGTSGAGTFLSPGDTLQVYTSITTALVWVNVYEH